MKMTTRMKDVIRFKRISKKTAFFLIAAVCIVGAATASAAYWTDTINLEASVDTLDVGISYESDELTIDTEKYIPGDSKTVAFQVNNSGDISVDIRPVITITADKDMKAASSTFVLTDDQGAVLTNFDVAYYDENSTEIASSSVAGGGAYRVIKYTMNEDVTLAGSVQNDEEDETDTSKEFSYKLTLAGTTNNDFIGATAGIDVSTYAIQHRNRNDGTGTWITGVQKIE